LRLQGAAAGEQHRGGHDGPPESSDGAAHPGGGVS
jgi:hypothetical protein